MKAFVPSRNRHKIKNRQIGKLLMRMHGAEVRFSRGASGTRTGECGSTERGFGP